MRILRIADVPDSRTGGMARFTRCMSDALTEAGHQVDFLFQGDLHFPLPGLARRFLIPPRIVQLIRRRAAAGLRYDAVEIHEPSAAAYCVARCFDRSLPPAVVISHGVESRCHRLMLDYLKSKGARLSLKQKYAYRMTSLWQADFALQHADQVVLSTSEDRDYLIHTLKIPPARVSIVNGGVTDTFLKCPTGAAPGLGVIFLASWIDRKGIRDAAAVFSQLARQHPGMRITVAGCGKPSEAVLADLPEDCRGGVQIISQIRGDDALLAEYRKHAIYFAPSVFEGQLLTMLEAAAAGLTPVCTATCGMKDFIRHEENGLLVGVGDAVGLAKAVSRLLQEPELRVRLGQQAQRDARAYTWKRSAEQYLAGLVPAISGGRRQRRAGENQSWAS